PVRETKHLRLDSWITVVIRHQCTAGDVRVELDQTRQIWRLRSRGPRAHHCLHPKRAATERLRGTGSLRGHELREDVGSFVELPILPYTIIANCSVGHVASSPSHWSALSARRWAQVNRCPETARC